MGILDYSEFGNSKLGYQPQIQQFSDAITEIMRDRQAKAKLEEERSFHQGELAQKRQHDNIDIAQENQRRQTAQTKETRDQQRLDQQRSQEGTQKLLERLRAGDTEGADAVGAAYGISPAAPASPADASPPQPQAAEPRALPPEVAAMASRQSPPAAEGLAGFDVDAAAQNLANVGHEPAPPPQSDVRQFSPSSQGESFMAPEDNGDQVSPPAPGPGGPIKRTYNLPGGGSFAVDPEQQRTGSRKQMAADFLSAHRARAEQMFRSASGRPPEVAAQIRAQYQQEMDDVERLAAGLAAGSLVPSAAGTELESSTRQRRAEGSASDLETRREAAAMARTQVMAGAASQRQAAAQPPAGEPDTKVETRYQADVSEAKRNSLAPADMKEQRTIDKLRKDLENPNGPQHQLAIDNITRLAVGGRAPVALAQALQGSIGLYQSTENWAYRQTHGGVSMPEVLDQYRKAMNDYHQTSMAQRAADAQAFEEQAGIRSHWFQVPEMRAKVLDHARAYYRELGLPIPPEYDQLMAPPSVAPAHGKKRKAPADDDEAFINGR